VIRIFGAGRTRRDRQHEAQRSHTLPYEPRCSTCSHLRHRILQ
jgi:hypothetical protein